MVNPLYNYKIKHFYEEFLILSSISAFSALITIRSNEHFKREADLCKTTNSPSIRCQLVKTPFYDNLELFIITFTSSFVSYTILYLLIGYGFKLNKS